MKRTLWFTLMTIAVVAFAGCSGDDSVTAPGDDNQVPTTSITADPTAVSQGDNNSTVVTLDGSTSADPDGDPLRFKWTVPNGTFVNGTTDSDAIIQVTFPGASPSTVTLVVDDGRDGTASAQFTIGIIAPANNAPTASISASPTDVPRGDNNSTVVTLDGSASSDPDGDQLSFAWTVPSGTFVNGTTASDPVIQVTFPGAAPYTVTLVVDDGRGGTDSAQVTIGLSN